MDVMLSLDDFAASRDVSIRTVKRWISGGQLPEARKVRGLWQIPAEAQRILPPEGSEGEAPSTNIAVAAVTRSGHGTAVTMSALLEQQPAYLELDVAAQLLGVPASTIRAHKAAFGAVRFGPRGSLVVPQRVVREAAGL